MRLMIRIKITIFIFTAILFFTFSESTLATIEVGEVSRSDNSQIYINYFSNHGYINQDLPLFYTHTAEALSSVRQELIETDNIRRLPILINIPSTIFQIEPDNTQISWESNCEVSYGDTIIEPTRIGDCYKIHYVGDISYDVLLTLVVGLSELEFEGEIISDVNTQSLSAKYAEVIKSLKDIEKYYYPQWSPDSNYLAYTVWEDNNLSYKILNIDNNQEMEIILSKNPINSPIWSSDSKYYAVATLQSVYIYDTSKESYESIELPSIDESTSVNNETLISLDTSNNRLLISRDTNLFASYEMYSYHLGTGELSLIAEDTDRPIWQDEYNEDEYLSKNSTTSPNGKWTATIDPIDNTKPPVIDTIDSEGKQEIILDDEKSKQTAPVTSQDHQNRNRVISLIAIIVILFALIVEIVGFFRMSKKE